MSDAPLPTRPPVKFENALDYLDLVKSRYRDQPHVYTSFLDTLKDFKTQTLNVEGVLTRVGELFRGHDDLIVGFNVFLPPGLSMPGTTVGASPAPQQQSDQTGAPNFDGAVQYVAKVKMRLQHQPQMYKSFLETLHTYHAGTYNINEVCEQVSWLLQDHPDLVEEFAQFLPQSTPRK